MINKLILSFLFVFLITTEAHAEQMPDFNRLVKAIYFAEGGSATRHPYGVLGKWSIPAKQVCMNTVKNQWKRHLKHNCGKDYFTCLRDRYCPIGASNDNGTNKYWLKNVLGHYKKGEIK